MSQSQGSQSVTEFLRSAANHLAAGGRTCIVAGNEAADLDSMASAVCWAWQQSREDDGSTGFPVPLITIPRGDFKLRTEAVYLFEQAGIAVDDLIFAEDVDLAALHGAGNLTMVLIDHNRPSRALAAYQDTVVGVVDHHADEGLFTDCAIRTIEPTGSAATLVARTILAAGDEPLEKTVALLLLGTILLDTVNLDPEAGRVTPEDQQVAEKLLAATGAVQQDLFGALQREKFNVSALDSADLLRKDYKEWQMGDLRVGVSSVLLSVEDWLKKDGSLSQSLAVYAESRNLDVLLAMNAYTNPAFTRELVVYCPAEPVRNRVVPFLEGGDLALTAISASRVDEATRLYAQGNAGISRKKLQPILSAFLEG